MDASVLTDASDALADRMHVGLVRVAAVWRDHDFVAWVRPADAATVLADAAAATAAWRAA